MKAYITVLSQRRPGHKIFTPAVMASPTSSRFLHEHSWRTRARARTEAQALSKTFGIPYHQEIK